MQTPAMTQRAAIVDQGQGGSFDVRCNGGTFDAPFVERDPGVRQRRASTPGSSSAGRAADHGSTTAAAAATVTSTRSPGSKVCRRSA